MQSSDVLGFPNFKKPFALATDALLQFLEWAYPKKRMVFLNQQDYLAVVWPIQHFRVYLEGEEFQLLMDNNALSYILKQSNQRGRIAHWVAFLNQFTYTVKHVQGSKNVVPAA